jgi:ABC-type dipeptide/oligopeptide/nickel transport system ATPase component
MSLLRPDFTQNIYKNYVLKSQSINIFGEKGIGKSRFIKDLLTLVDENIKVVTMDMRTVRHNYDKFIEALQEKLEFSYLSQDKLSDLLEHYTDQYEQTLFIIDNFEELYKDNVDKRYDFDFFGELNAYKNKPNTSLIILSSRNYSHHNFYNQGKLSVSPLDIPVKEMIPLTLDDIEAELRARCKTDVDIKYDKLANMIIGNQEVYNFIEFIIREINEFNKYDDNATLYMNYEELKEQFHKENNISVKDQVIEYAKQNPEKAKNIFTTIWNFIKMLYGKWFS